MPHHQGLQFLFFEYGHLGGYGLLPLYLAHLINKQRQLKLSANETNIGAKKAKIEPIQVNMKTC